MAFRKNGHAAQIKKFLGFAYTEEDTLKFDELYNLMPVTQDTLQEMKTGGKHQDLAPFFALLPQARFYPLSDTSWDAVSAEIKKSGGSAVNDDRPRSRATCRRRPSRPRPTSSRPGPSAAELRARAQTAAPTQKLPGPDPSMKDPRLQLTTTPDSQPLTVGINNFIGNYTVQCNYLSAGPGVAVLPVVVPFGLIERKVVSGLTASSVT